MHPRRLATLTAFRAFSEDAKARRGGATDAVDAFSINTEPFRRRREHAVSTSNSALTPIPETERPRTPVSLNACPWTPTPVLKFPKDADLGGHFEWAQANTSLDADACARSSRELQNPIWKFRSRRCRSSITP